jgi:hypothetical protein
MRVELAGLPAAQPKQHAPHVKSGSGLDWRPGTLQEGLAWTHYRLLQKEDRRPVRDFYEMESVRHSEITLDH